MSAETFLVGALHDPCLRLRRPIPLHVAHGRVWSVSYNPWNWEWGQGDHLTAAVEHWQAGAATLYWWLRAHQAALRPHLGRVWATLQADIEERHAPGCSHERQP